MWEKKEISYEKTQNSLEKSKEAFVFLKKDILNPYFSFYFEQKISKISTFKSAFSIDKSEHIRKQIKNILNNLDSKWYKKENIEKIEIWKNGLVNFFVEKEENKQTLIFDINWSNPEEFYKWDEQKVYAENMEINRKILEKAEKAERAVDAMDYIFDKNEKEWFWDLNDEDILTTDEFWKELKFYNLKQLAEIVKKYLKDYDSISTKFRWNNEINKKVLKTKQRFFDMIMWIWDKYEGAAEYIKKDEEDLVKLAPEIIKWLSTKETLDYLRKSNKKIDENNYQSTSVEQSYQLFSKTINSLVFYKFKKENASQKDFLEFAKIISWKNESALPWGEAWVDDNLKSSSETMEILNDIILHLMMKKWWIMEKLNKSNLSKIEDEKIWDKDTFKIVGDFQNILAEKLFWNSPKKELLVNTYINNLWYWDILNIKEWQKYSDISFEQKAKISVIYRVIEKINDLWKDKINDTKLYELFKSVAVDASEEIVENMTDNFWKWSIKDWLWGKSAEDLWLTNKIDVEIYEFFKDFQWVWALDFSDRSISNLKTTGKFVAVMAVAMATLPVSASVWVSSIAIQWAMVWATASVASIAINPKWYDTVWEALTDISSDIALWTATWYVWWAYAARFEWLNAKFFSKEVLKNQKAIMGIDLIFLWLLPEAWRMMSVDSYFHDWIFKSKEILDNQ